MRKKTSNLKLVYQIFEIKMSTDNFLPPINKKHHRLNTEKALETTNKNIIACHDSGVTSDAYKINPNNVTENVNFKFRFFFILSSINQKYNKK